VPQAQTMIAGTVVAPGAFELRTVEMPVTAPEGWVLVDIVRVGICGTDYHIFEGKHPFLQYPRVIGHELAGRIVGAAGGMDAGTLVVINPYISCGTCRACTRGKPNCCTRIAVLGVHRDGGMCARVAVPLANLYPATGLSENEAAMVEFLAIGAHAVSRPEVTAADRVLVTGAGPIGIGAALFARMTGAEVHLLDLSPQRLAMTAERFGFEHLHHSLEDALSGELADGYDVVFDATGSARAIEAGFALLAHGATYVLVSVVKGAISFDDSEFHKREARIVGSRNALKSDFDTVISAMRSKAFNTSALVSELIDLADLPTKLPPLVADRNNQIKVVVRLW
jgi:2-desacetyl-2-hydroxyethyl bacteriochlorophyllide A dehydrogenase